MINGGRSLINYVGVGGRGVLLIFNGLLESVVIRL